MRLRSFVSTLAVAVCVVAGGAGPVRAAGTASITPNPVAFGDVAVGSSSLLTATVTNTSGSSGSFDEVGLTGAYAYDNTSAPDVPRPGACWYAGTGGVVRSEIEPGGTCLLYYRFTPGAAGASSGTSTVTTYDFIGSPVDHTTVAVNGTGTTGGTGPATTGAFTVSPTSLSFGNVKVGSSLDKSVVVTNTSNGNVQMGGGFAPPENYDIAPGTAPTDCFAAGNTGPAMVLSPQGTCRVRVRFAPQSTGTKAGPLVLTVRPSSGVVGTRASYSSLEVLASKNVTTTGAGVAATFSLTPTSLAFGNVEVGATKSLAVTVKNTDQVTMQVVPAFAPDVPYDVEESSSPGACRSTGRALRLAPAATCVYNVRFRPTASGAANKSLTFVARATTGTGYADATGIVIGTKALSASGTGVAPPWTISATSHAFGNVTVGGSDVTALTVTNKSTRVLAVRSTASASYAIGQPRGVDMPGTAPFGAPFCTGYTFDQTTFLTLQLRPGDACVVLVEARPTALGSKPGSAVVEMHTADAAAAPGTYAQGQAQGMVLGSKSVSLSMTGVVPTYTVTPSSAAFGNVVVGGTKEITLTVKNTSDAIVQYSATAPGGVLTLPVAIVTGTSCYGMNVFGRATLQVGIGQECTMTLRFAPTASGAKSGTFSIRAHAAEPGASPGDYLTDNTSNRPVLASKSVSANGTGVLPSYTVTPTSVAFGSVAVGGSKDVAVTVKNTSTHVVQYSAKAPGGAFKVGLPFSGTTPQPCFGVSVTGRVALQVGPGQSCVVILHFEPTATGPASGGFAIRVHAAEPGAAVGSYVTDATDSRLVAGSKPVTATGTGTS